MTLPGWIESGGGPLLLLPAEHLDAWEGTDPPRDGRPIRSRFRWNPASVPCDYDRACDVEDLVGAIPVGAGAAVVLGDEPLATTWRPLPGVPGGAIVRWRHAPSREHARRRLEALCRLDFEPTDCVLETASGRVALFDAAVPGASFEADGTGAWLDLPAGRYRVGVREWRPDPETALLLHPLVAV